MTVAEFDALAGRLFVVSSPSGGGKSTLIQFAREALKPWGGPEFSVSHTTRSPRKGERNGREYHFVTADRFRQMVEANAFLEYAEVHGNYYGTSYAEVRRRLREGLDVILDIDVQGARQIFEKEPAAIGIFIAPPSFPELERRLRGRGLDPQAVVDRRLAAAWEEMQHYGAYPYVIINDEIDRAGTELVAVFLAPKLEARRQKIRMEKILDSFGQR